MSNDVPIINRHIKQEMLFYNVAGDSVVRVENIVKVFGKRTVLKGINFNIVPGEVYGLLGPNGAGKTTVIKILCGAYKATRGTAYVAGYDVAKHVEKVRRMLGYMSQKFTLYQDLTVDENLAFYADIYGLKGDSRKKRIKELCDLVSLTDRGEDIVKNLSGGWKQRLALVCALLHQPPILILDEPTAGVDPISRKTFWKIILQLAAGGLAVLVTTHYMDEAEFCDVIAITYDGNLIIEGPPKDLIRDAGVRTLGEIFESRIADYEVKKAAEEARLKQLEAEEAAAEQARRRKKRNGQDF